MADRTADRCVVANEIRVDDLMGGVDVREVRLSNAAGYEQTTGKDAMLEKMPGDKVTIG